MKIKAIIVDDEPRAAMLLEILIKECCPDIEIVGKAVSVSQAVESYTKLKPGLIFLDIQMPDGSGFDLLNRIKLKDCKIIFVTAYDKYAIKAFKFSATDYLLKPVNEEELIRAVEKIVKNASHPLSNEIASEISNNYDNIRRRSGKLALSTLSGYVFIDIKNLIRCEADGKYTTCFLAGNEKVVVSKNLGEFESILEDYNFLRIHNSHLVNIDCIKNYHAGRGGYVTMSDECTLTVSQRKKEEFFKRINRI